jgi:predicted pyridoxine 5'-phosphate oxidase superfamily flavin-nucleotide-binding protein
MARAFAKIAFTANVRAAQARMGSRDAYRATGLGEAEEVALGPHEIEFIGARDSFYQGTVGETGWPYVQHRGGPTGFLKVLGPQTLGYADFSGNRQYISVGNLGGDDRVSLFLMDYPAQRRLKIWGRARLVDEDEEPALLARLESPDYRARVERGVRERRDRRHAVLIAGGIGITPIKAMAHALKARSNAFDLHYSGRTAAEMAYRDRLTSDFPGQLHLYFSRVQGAPRLDLRATLASAPPTALFYVCGPGRLIEAARAAASELHIPAGRVQYESFE